MPRPPNPMTRERMLMTAAMMFADRGFAAVSMADVAREADVTKANLFHYFPTKELLGLAVLEKMRHGLEMMLSMEFHENAREPIETVCGFFRRAGIVMSSAKPPPFVRPTILHEMASQGDALGDEVAAHRRLFLEKATNFFQPWFENGFFRKDVEPTELAQAVMSLWHGCMNDAILSRDPSSFQAAERLLFVLLPSLKSSQP